MDHERFLEQLPVGVFRSTIDGEYLYVNPALVDLLGADSRDTVIERGSPPFYAEPGSREEFVDALEEQGNVLGHEVRIEQLDGTELWGSMSAWLTTSDGRSIIEGVIEDISERRRIEQESVERERRLQQLMDSTDDALWLFDAEWQETLYINAAYEDIWGQSTESLYDDPKTFLEGVHPEDREAVQEGMATLSAGESAKLEFRVNPDEDFQRWVSVQGSPVVRDGEVIRIAGYTREITDRKREQRDKAAYTASLNEIYEITTDTEREFEQQVDELLTIGADYLGVPYGFLTDIDVAAEAGGDGTQTIVTSVGSHEQLQSGASCPLGESYCRTTIESNDLQAIHDAPAAGWEADPAYERFNLGSYIGGSVYVDGDLEGTVCFAGSAPRDEAFSERERALVWIISQWVSHQREQQRRRKELRQRNERLQQFAYIASHDLQEPLRMVSSYIDLLDSEYGDEFDEEAREYMDFAIDGADRMRNMIDDLLKFARVESEAEQPHSVDPNEAIDDVLDDLQLSIKESDASVTVGELPEVRADPNQLRQLFQNLVANAIDYAGDEPPEIDIDAENGINGVLFTVSDQGIGIPEQQQDNIFQVFTRGTRDDGTDNTGIGLAICQRIVTRHGGDIWVDSEPDEGTTFCFTLPTTEGTA
ncbi:PAS domain S-box-containing protein [Natronoarchaeum philippinense]|uniref:histidine kinase n=1 Tax=Natronoarchaeum philippinense TaxID=558529 RepID=A0A285NUX4_NATPI|nr:ATP-binding protein [Natronoarchaeum philippinense]SNZ13239.1 PAS domain S-box-containing protein [Natronoarchaeum philippinense]